MPRPCNHEILLADRCRICWLFESDSRYRVLWGGPAELPVAVNLGALSVAGPVRLGNCPNLGKPLDRVDSSGTACGCVGKWLHSCDLHDRCTINESRPGIKCCQNCNDYPIEMDSNMEVVSRRKTLQEIRWPVTFNEWNLAPNMDGKRFNTSIIDWEDGYLIAYRSGWAGSEIYVQRLDQNFAPIGDPIHLDLWHDAAAYGREDPRFFMFRGALHITYIGVIGEPLHTNVLYARLSNDLRVEAKFAPHFPGRNLWEKNWQFFECDSELYAVYSIAPHRVLKIDGDRAALAYNTPTRATWHGGEMRGGASPVRIGDEFYCFFHSSMPRDGFERVYNTGLYTFDAKPPFYVRRIISEPILWPNGGTRPVDQYTPVVFPCGAVLRDDHWIVSHGIHDRWTELHIFFRDHLESRLQEIDLPGWCSPEKAKFLGEFVAQTNALHAVEIGVFGGKSLIPMGKAMRALNRNRAEQGYVLGIDPYSTAVATEGLDPENAQWWRGVDLDSVFKEALDAISRFDLQSCCSLMRAASQDVAPLISDTIDVLHVDGSHSEEASSRDVSLWLPKVRSGGIVVLDDTNLREVQSARGIVARQCDLIRTGTGETVWEAYRKRGA